MRRGVRGLRDQLRQMGHDGLRLVFELARREADRQHAGGPAPHVAAAVALERGAVSVEPPAVDLDLPSLIVLPIDYSLDVAISEELGPETVIT